MLRVPVLVPLALAIALSAPFGAAALTPAGNGYLLMVHGTFEPGTPPGPPAVQEAVATTQDGGFVDFHVAVFDVVTGAPVVVQDPVLKVQHGLVVTSFTPNGDPADFPLCEYETTLPGHEGPLAACNVFHIEASWFDVRPVVFFTLEFADADGPGVEVYNGAAHGEIHSSHNVPEGGAEARARADAYLTAPTPFVVQSRADLVG